MRHNVTLYQCTYAPPCRWYSAHMLIVRYAKKIEEVLDRLEAREQGKASKVARAIGRLAENPWHSGLHTHKYAVLKGENGEDVFTSYVENRAPSAWRIWWHWGPGKDEITIVDIGPHK